jgi:hypothetical protein
MYPFPERYDTTLPRNDGVSGKGWPHDLHLISVLKKKQQTNFPLKNDVFLRPQFVISGVTIEYVDK